MDAILADIENSLRLLVKDNGLIIVSKGFLEKEISVVQPYTQHIEMVLDDITSVLNSHSMLERIYEMMYKAIAHHLVQDIAVKIFPLSGIVWFLKYFNKICEIISDLPILTLFQYFVERHEAFQTIPLDERQKALKWVSESVILEFISACASELQKTVSVMIDLYEVTKRGRKVKTSKPWNTEGENPVLRKTCQILLYLPLSPQSCAIYKEVFAKSFEKQMNLHSCTSEKDKEKILGKPLVYNFIGTRI